MVILRSNTTRLQDESPRPSNIPRLAAVFLALILVAVGVLPTAVAATFNVSDSAGLRAALLAAATNGQDDVITLASSTYATGGAAFSFVTNENKTLTIQGVNGTSRNQVILDGGGTSRVLDFGCVSSCGAITLRGLTIQNGSVTGGDGSGGGVKSGLLIGLVISEIAFLGNRATFSGGAISSSGGATITNSTFSQNSAGSGGAVSSTTVIVDKATFSNNSASSDGGAIFAVGGEGTVSNSNFTNNTAGGVGGAIQIRGNIVNSTFSGNSAAGSGAAVSLYILSGSIINSVFYGHSTPAVYAASAYSLYNNLIDTSTGLAGSLPDRKSVV